jgi:hypothetical protein
MLSSHPKSNSGIAPKQSFGAFSMSPRSENSEPLLARAVGKKTQNPLPQTQYLQFFATFCE